MEQQQGVSLRIIILKKTSYTKGDTHNSVCGEHKLFYRESVSVVASRQGQGLAVQHVWEITKGHGSFRGWWIYSFS